MGVVNVTFPATTRSAAVGGISRSTRGRSSARLGATTFFSRWLMVLARMLTVLMAAAGTAKPLGLVIVGHVQRSC